MIFTFLYVNLLNENMYNICVMCNMNENLL
jgi:hypothetical protein